MAITGPHLPTVPAKGDFMEITRKINLDTIALLPVRRIEFNTLIISNDGKEYVPDLPFNVIKTACTAYWGEYEGIRKAVIKHTKFIQKTPMPICKRRGIYFFPTHSPHNIDNCWIALKHIANIDRIPPRLRTKHSQSIVYFKNGLTLTLCISYHTLKEQYERASECMLRIEGD